MNQVPSIDKETWNRMVRAVELKLVSLREFKASHNLPLPESPEILIDPLSIRPEIKWLFQAEKDIHFADSRVYVDVGLKVTYRQGRKKVASFKAKYELLFTCENEDCNEFETKIWAAFMKRTLPLLVGPVFRELVSGVSGRMGVLLPAIPLFKIP